MEQYRLLGEEQGLSSKQVEKEIQEMTTAGQVPAGTQYQAPTSTKTKRSKAGK